MSTPRPKAYLSRRYHFSASHRLHTEALDAEQNQILYGKCNHPYGHGHNYTVEVTMAGEVRPDTGMVTNLADLDRFAHERLLTVFDCSNLNLLGCFNDAVPTTENLLLEIQKIFSEYSLAQLAGLRVEETSNNSFELEHILHSHLIGR